MYSREGGGGAGCASLGLTVIPSAFAFTAKVKFNLGESHIY